jgi:hypothetical protein
MYKKIDHIGIAVKSLEAVKDFFINFWYKTRL